MSHLYTAAVAPSVIVVRMAAAALADRAAVTGADAHVLPVSTLDRAVPGAGRTDLSPWHKSFESMISDGIMLFTLRGSASVQPAAGDVATPCIARRSLLLTA